MTLIKSISGIRGTIGGLEGDNLTPLDVVKFSVGYSRWLIKKNPSRRLKVVIGRDARISGGMVYDLVEGSVLGCGIDIVDVGLCTTPGVELAVTVRGADGGIIITASHNPAQWNALKLLGGNGEFLDAAEGAEVLALAEDGGFTFPEVEKIGRVVEKSDFNREHIDMALALPLVDIGIIKSKKFKIVVDGINSVGGIIVPELLQRMGCEVVCMNCEPDGNFAHNPEPIAENLTAISRKVVEEKADLGIVVDPDVDRLAFVMENGELFGEEYTLVAVADYVLSHTPGNSVSNLSSTRALKDITEKYGKEYFASAVGEVNVVAEMKRVGAVIGGEGNGGVIYPALHYGRDAIAGIALFLTSLALKGVKISGLRTGYPEYYICKNKLELASEVDFDEIIDVLKCEYSRERLTETDGLRIDFTDGWIHLRKSNTEPIVRIYSEGDDKESAGKFALQVMDLINRMM